MHISDLEKYEIERFSRQIIVPGVGTQGQKKLRNTKVMVVGCGGLGCPLLMYLATCGITTIGIADHDKVEIHNLQRQILYKEAEIGEYKVECAYRFIKSISSNINIDMHKYKVTCDNVEKMVRDYDIVVDCTDSIETRYLLSDCTRKYDKDLICASVVRWEGHLYVFKNNGPCYRCLFPNIKATVTSCDENGIIGPICGVFGSLLGLEVIKCILEITETKMIVYNGMTDKFSTFRLRDKKLSCLACNGRFAELTYERPTCASQKIIPSGINEADWNEVLCGKYTLLDVRSRVQYDMFRIEKSINVPFASLATSIDKLKGQKHIAVICKRGITSLKACEILKTHGIDAVSVRGGIDEYKSTLND